MFDKTLIDVAAGAMIWRKAAPMRAPRRGRPGRETFAFESVQKVFVNEACAKLTLTDSAHLSTSD
jgi:hypothetical protein